MVSQDRIGLCKVSAGMNEIEMFSSQEIMRFQHDKEKKNIQPETISVIQ